MNYNIYCYSLRSRIRILGRLNLAQRCKRFTTASASTQVAVLPWRYDVDMGTVKGNNRISRTIVILYSRFYLKYRFRPKGIISFYSYKIDKKLMMPFGRNLSF